MHPPADLTDLAARLRRHVVALAGAPRAPDTPGHRAAAAYIRRHLEQAGFTVPQPPGDGALPLPCVNLITDPRPADPGRPLVVVGAHYDSVLDSPGADDNASAVAALLELAAWAGPLLADAPPRGGRLQLAAYDLEEYGLVGSAMHCRGLRESAAALRGMIALEMVGYTDRRPGSQQLPPHLRHLYPDVGDFIGVCGNEASVGLVQAVTEAMASVPGLPVECLAVPGKGESLPEVRLSDHTSFWEHGYPALMVTDTSFFRNPHYHRASDTPDTLDYDFLARVTAGVCAAVAALLA